jgi:hypothetical protein
MTTKDMKIFLLLIKNAAILQSALYSKELCIRICRRCKIVIHRRNNNQCNLCQEILLGIKLRS